MRHRGRKSNPNAKRRQTTRAGRRADPDAVVQLAKRRRARLTLRADLEPTPLGVLLGRNVISRQQYDAALYYAALVAIWRKAFGLSDGSVEPMYRRFLAGQVDGNTGAGDATVRTVADLAAREISRFDSLLSVPARDVVRAIGDGTWLPCVATLVQHDIRFAKGAERNLHHLDHRHATALDEIKAALRELAKIPQRLQSLVLDA
jgi:hypothetical protein